MSEILQRNYLIQKQLQMYKKFITNSVTTFYAKEEFIDVTFICKDNVHIRAHKMLLISVSNLFKNILHSSNEDMMYVSLPDIEGVIMEIFINFMYEGCTKVNNRELALLNELITFLDIHIFNCEIQPEKYNYSSINEEDILETGSLEPGSSYEDAYGQTNVSDGNKQVNPLQSLAVLTSEVSRRFSDFPEDGNKAPVLEISDIRSISDGNFESTIHPNITKHLEIVEYKNKSPCTIANETIPEQSLSSFPSAEILQPEHVSGFENNSLTKSDDSTYTKQSRDDINANMPADIFSAAVDICFGNNNVAPAFSDSRYSSISEPNTLEENLLARGFHKNIKDTADMSCTFTEQMQVDDFSGRKKLVFENHDVSSHISGQENFNTENFYVDKISSLSKDQKLTLERIFNETQYLGKKLMTEVSECLKITRPVLSRWFSQRRARKKSDGTTSFVLKRNNVHLYDERVDNVINILKQFEESAQHMESSKLYSALVENTQKPPILMKKTVTDVCKSMGNINNQFTCKLCGKMFLNNMTLAWHSCSEYYSHKCRYCDASFKRLRECNQHEKLHGFETPYKCNICEAQFLVQKYLRKHYKTAHSVIRPMPPTLFTNGEFSDIATEERENMADILKVFDPSEHFMLGTTECLKSVPPDLVENADKSFITDSEMETSIQNPEI